MGTTSIPALDLPIQFFAVGTAIGMLASLIRYYHAGEVDHWPIYIAWWAVGFFFIGLIDVGLDALR